MHDPLSVNVQENTVEIIKAKHGKTSGKSYIVKKENIYKALPFVPKQQGYQEHDHEERETIKNSQECFFL